MKKILFIGHDASRTGAPILLLHIIKWFSENKDFQITILLKNSGELFNEYAQISKTFLWNDTSKYPKNIIEKIKYKLYTKNYKNRIVKKIKSYNFDFIYANTIDSLDLLEIINSNTSKNILHIHELNYAIKTVLTEKKISEYDKIITKYISVSNAVKQNLLIKHKIDKNKIETIYAFADYKKADLSKIEIKKELNLTEKDFIIGNIGRVDWLKGFDMFILIAKKIIEYDLPIKFLWVGNFTNEVKIQIETEIEKYNLKNLIFTGGKENSANYYQIFDVFLLTSREDSFPLVVLEASSNQLPVLCFENSGGASEFIENDKNGIICPFGNYEYIAEKIKYLYENKVIVKEMGLNNFEKVKNYTIDITCNKINELINNL